MQEPSKSKLREILRQRRQLLPPDQIRRDSLRVRSRLLDLPQMSAARTVMLYLSFQNEIDTWPLLHHCWKLGILTLLPRCCPDASGQMDVHLVGSLDDLGPGCFGLTEPRPQSAPLVKNPRPDIVLVPALGFDRRGQRIGFGRGYYDRFLPGLDPAPLLVGAAYDFQIVHHVPADPWDIPVHLIATPGELIVTSTEPRT